MPFEPFTPESVDSDRILDAEGRDVGRLLATEGGSGAAMRVVLQLNDAIRDEHAISTRKMVVPAWRLHVENRQPRLECTLHELLDVTGEAHSHTGNVVGQAERRPPHFGAPADESKAPQSESTRTRGGNMDRGHGAPNDPRRAD